MLAGCGPINKVAGLIESRSGSTYQKVSALLDARLKQEKSEIRTDQYVLQFFKKNDENEIWVHGYVQHVPRFTDSLFVRDPLEKQVHSFIRYLHLTDKDYFIAVCERLHHQWQCRVKRGVDAL